MNTFKKHNGEWTIQVLSDAKTGDTVTVLLASGATKQITLGEHISGALYRVAKTPAPEAKKVGELSGILAMFDRAKDHLKFPAIVFGNDRGGIRITIAGQEARVPGSLTVTSQEKDNRDGRRAWFGRVHRDGTYEASRQVTPGVAEYVADMITRFAADPVKVAGEYGRLTGCCCFCNRALSDERSTAVGYGPICADRFGLPWGNRNVEDDEREMQRLEAEGDREQTRRDEERKAKFKFEGWINR